MSEPSNFSFLSETWPELYGSAREAEELAGSAPRSGAFGCRYTMEQAVNWIYAADSTLKRPYRDNLASLIHEQSFKDLLPPGLFESMLYILKTGNLAAHGEPKGKPITPVMALMAVRHVHTVMQWFALSYGDPPPAVTAFNEDAFPADTRTEKSNDRLEQLQRQLEETKKRLRRRYEENDELRREVERIKKRNAGSVQAVSFQPDTATEAETRTLLIDVMLSEAGWKLDGANDREYEVRGMPNEQGVGYVDYVLWDADGTPLAVVEAKRSAESPERGKHQAKLYADCIERMHGKRPLIFYTNGYELYLWDDRNYPPRRLLGFYTQDELRRHIRRRDERGSITDQRIDPKIVERHYQIEAIARLGEAFEEKRRRALLVMATGTGKTRTAIAAVDVMMRAGWVQRVLFLADRNALVEQARKAFVAHLPSVSVSAYSRAKADDQSRVVVATYPSILNAIDETRGGRRPFSVGTFDLIIIDEAHRSIYKKFGAIFDYFDGLILGLTATPKSEVDRNTYRFFELEDELPTAAYELGEAVNDGYLVPFKNLSVPIKFPREGIKYDDLSEEEKLEYEETFYDEESEELPEFIESNKINQWVFNEDTVDKVIQYLMENGLNVAGGDRIGKTIIFARNHRHAQFISERFNALYPDKAGDFLSVIDNQVSYAQDLIEHFGVKEDDPTIAVSVDMLDTGIDVPEVLNLVFFKIVRSKAKFWQMIGRGTRTCKELFGPGEDKSHFLILDFCENFEFFGETPEGIINPPQHSLTERIFNRRLTLAQLLRHGDYQDDAHQRMRGELLDTLHAGLCRIREVRGDTLSVRKERRYLDTYAERRKWDTLSELEIQDIRDHIAPLTFAEDTDEVARRFDLLALNLAIAMVEKTPAENRYRKQIVAVADYLYANAMNIPAVANKRATIVNVRQDELWAEATPSTVEWIRKELRDLVRFIESKERFRIVRTDFQDELEIADEGPDITGGAFELHKYREKVESFIRRHQDLLVINKIRFNEPITATELQQLDEVLQNAQLGSLNEIRTAFGTDKPLALLIRRIVGLDMRTAKEAFGRFLRKHPSLTADQMRFINRLIDHLSRFGHIEPEELANVPYTDFHPRGVMGIFPEDDAMEIKSVLDEINKRAEVG